MRRRRAGALVWGLTLAGAAMAGGIPARAASGASSQAPSQPPSSQAPSQASASSGAPGPSDPLFSRQWNLTKVGALAAWTRSTGQNVLIGIVDTGVDLQHEDLAGKVVADTDCVGANGNPAGCVGSAQDDNGHGTHVAGIAAADTNNGKGVAGMAPSAGLVVAKALDSQGNGSIGDVNAAIEWVVNHGARVVNLSLGSDMPTLSGLLGGNSLSPGIEYAWSHGAIPVLAAGNENFFGLGSSNYGNADAVIVGATGPRDEVAPYSSPMGNAKWALVAPGGDGQDASGNPTCAAPASASCMVSTWWTVPNPSTAYAYDQGTSMATPMVSGTLALLLSHGMSQSAAVQTLLASADHSVSCGSGCAGRLDAAKALGVSGAVSPFGSATAAGASTPASPGPGAGGAPPSPGGSPAAPGLPAAAPPAVAAGGSGAPSTTVAGGVQRPGGSGGVPGQPTRGGATVLTPEATGPRGPGSGPSVAGPGAVAVAGVVLAGAGLIRARRRRR